MDENNCKNLAENNANEIKNDINLTGKCIENEEINECEKSTVSANDVLMQNILEKLNDVSTGICNLKNLFNDKIMYSEHEEKIVNEMHSELKKYKEDMYAQLIKPILSDVIEIRDSIQRTASNYQSRPKEEQNIPIDLFELYSVEIQDLLEKNGVELYKSDVGGVFQPLKQRVVKKVMTDDESMHGKIAESLSSGYSYMGKVISAEKIIVYCNEKNMETKI